MNTCFYFHHVMLSYIADSYIYQQILEKKKEVIVVPEDMLKIVKTFFELTIRNLYQKIFPAFSSEKITLLADNVAFTIIALSGGLLQSFQNKGCMEQFKSSNMLYTSSSWDFYQKLHPQITRIKPIDLMVSFCTKATQELGLSICLSVKIINTLFLSCEFVKALCASWPTANNS